MGLTITSEINTDAGTTTSAYLNITECVYRKNNGYTGDGSLDITTNLYLDEAARISEPSIVVSSAGIYKYFGYTGGSPDVLTGLKDTDNLFEFAYSQIKETLENLGFTVEDAV